MLQSDGMNSHTDTSSHAKGNPPPRRRRLGFLSFLQSAWAAPLFLAPFLLMLGVHQLLGLSDALLVAEGPGERPAQGFNLLLGINMNLCPLATILHLFKSQRTFPWIIARLLIPMSLFLLGLLTL